MLTRSVLALCSLLWVSCPAQQKHPSELTAKSDGYVARLWMRSERISGADGDGEVWWGMVSGGIVPVVKRVDIAHKKHVIPVPVSAYSGLTLARKLHVLPSNGGCKVEIIGSDAAGSYTCTILVKGGEVVERTVRSGEFPELNYERTTYRTPRPGEID